MSGPFSVPEPWNDVALGYDKYAVELFKLFAQHAYDLLGLLPERAVLDVACGSGAVTTLLAEKGHRVTAVDFSEAMLKCCRARLSERNLSADLHQMDGQALKFEDQSFDAVSSMFGWMFFPDRAKGLSEFNRVLKPGGALVVSSWAPVSESPLMQLMMGAVREITQDVSEQSKIPSSLEDESNLATELFAVGFDNVQIIRSTHGLTFTDLDEFWHGAEQSSAPLVMLKKKMGQTAWEARVPSAKAYLRKHCPPLPTALASTAWIAVAQKPEN